MGKACTAAYHAEGPTSRKAIQDSRRGGRTCQHSNGLPGNQNHPRARKLGLLSAVNRLFSLVRLFDRFVSRFLLFVRRSCSFRRGCGWLRQGLSRSGWLRDSRGGGWGRRLRNSRGGGWGWWLGDRLSRFRGRGSSGGCWGRCNCNWRFLLHFRPGKIMTGAQDNARYKEQTGYDKKR